MKSCWSIDPDLRPTFHELTHKFEVMLSDDAEYLDLTPNIIHNRTYFNTLSNDEESDEENSKFEEESTNLDDATSKSYMKIGEKPIKLYSSGDDNQKDLKVHGYETPVKVQRKIELRNDSNEGYTDMSSAKSS